MGIVLVHDRTQPPGSPMPVCSKCKLVERVFVQLIPLDGPHADGTPKTDRFTDNLGKFGTEGIAQVFGTKHFELWANEANTNPNFRSSRVRTDDIENNAVQIPLDRVGTGTEPPPLPGEFVLTKFPHPHVAGVFGYGTQSEWKVVFHELVRKYGLTIMEHDTGPQPNLLALTTALDKVVVPAGFTHCQLQNHERGDGRLKPRGFLPTSDRNHFEGSPSGPYSRIVDFGDFGFPFFEGKPTDSQPNGQKDVWQLTPPSW